MLSIFMALFILFAPINLDDIFPGLSFGGWSPFAWVLYPFYILLIGYFLFKMAKNKKFDAPLLLWYAFFLMSLLMSFMASVPWQNILINSLYYALPVLLYPAVMTLEEKQVLRMEKLVSISSIISGILSLAFLLGIIVVSREGVGELDRSSTMIDGGMGLVATALGLSYVLYGGNKYPATKYILLISGFLIIMAGMSRARIAMMLVIVALSLLFDFARMQGEKSRRFRLIVFLVLALLLLCLIFPDTVFAMVERVFARFSELGTDNSSLYRGFERDAQMRHFYDNPIFGVGWGGMYDVRVRNTYGVAVSINNHNMYSSLLCEGGLLYTLPFALWFCVLFFRELCLLRKEKSARMNIILMLTMVIMGIASAGFVKYSMTIGMLLVYLNIRKRTMKHEENRSVDLSQTH